MNARVAETAARLPNGPGVYIFVDAAGHALYVGKAADLRARVRSYLKPGGDGRPLLRFLEHEAADVEFVVTATEQEALLLENTVIKKRQPPYNIKLKDDKAFLLLRIDLREPWPWFRLVRRRLDDGAQYFGPYASAKSVRRSLRTLHKVVPLRDCNDAVFHNRARPCLKHEIGRCPAPCVGLIGAADYRAQVQRAIDVLQGGSAALVRDLRQQMADASAALQFERAQALKLQIDALSAIAEKQQVVARREDADAFGVHRAGDRVTVAVLAFRDGALESCRRIAVPAGVPDEVLLGELLSRWYQGDPYVPGTVLVPGPVQDGGLLQAWLGGKRGGAVEIAVPQRGVRRRWLDLAVHNAEQGDAAAVDAESRRRQGAARLAELLDLPEPPALLHCLDISTLQGTNTVASRVTFRDGVPDKSGYRRFVIRDEHAGDDFAAMREAVGRSLAQQLERDEELPDLLIVDGGSGQLAAAQAAVAELNLDEQVPLCGLAKSRLRGVGEQRRESGERLFRPGAEQPLPLPPDAPETLLVAHLRDEAHRFAITFHRQRRQRLGSALDELPGIGAARRKLLLRRFGSLAGLRAASRDELRGVPGLPAAVADRLYDRLQDR